MSTGAKPGQYICKHTIQKNLWRFNGGGWTS